jgi:hypothetical protein
LEREGDTIAREAMTAQQFTRVMYRLTAVLKKMGLGTTITNALGGLSRMIYMTRMLIMSLHFLQMSTPYGWVMGIMGLATVGFTSGEMLSDSMVGRG